MSLIVIGTIQISVDVNSYDIGRKVGPGGQIFSENANSFYKVFFFRKRNFDIA